MNELQQKSEANKYSSALVWHFAEVAPGWFALYDHERKVIITTQDWNEILAIYRSRPTYTPPTRVAKPALNINISKLDFNI